MKGLNLYIPLVYSNDDGPYKTTKDLTRAVYQNLYTLFNTNIGERVMDYDFGIGLKRFLFENITQYTIQKLEERIYTQIRKYMPFISILKLTINFQEEYNKLNINMQYKIDGVNETFLFSIDESGT